MNTTNKIRENETKIGKAMGDQKKKIIKDLSSREQRKRRKELRTATTTKITKENEIEISLLNYQKHIFQHHFNIKRLARVELKQSGGLAKKKIERKITELFKNL